MRLFRRRSWLIWGLALLAPLALLAGTALTIYRASQQVPAFYKQAIAQDAVAQQKASDQLLQQATALVSDVRKRGAWQALFTAEQINGWLAVDLPKNYPDLLPEEVRNPRVDIKPGEATIACRYQNGDLATVFSLSVDVYLSSANVVAVRIHKARAGALPLPLKSVLDAISEAAANVNYPLKWQQIDGDPVALIAIASPHDEDDNVLELENIELRAGEVFFAGLTQRPRSSSEGEARPALELPSAKVDQPPGEESAPLVGAAVKVKVQR